MQTAIDQANNLLAQTSGPQSYAGAADGESQPSISPEALAADLNALSQNIQQAYTEFAAELTEFGADATRIDPQLSAAMLFNRSDAALASKIGSTASVRNHLLRVAAHLAITEDLMLLGTITPETLALASQANARTNITIGPANGGYSPTLSPLAPASLGSVFGSAAVSPLGTQAAFASLGSNNTLPYELGGVNVTVAGTAVPVIFVSPGRVSFFVPSDLPSGVAEVIVSSQDGYLSRGTTNITRFISRIMTSSDDENDAAVVVNGRKQNATYIDVMTPENFGSDKRTRLSIFATGVCGSATNTNPGNDIAINGVVQPNYAETVVVEARKSNGTVYTLPVEFAGAANTLPGLDQISVVLLPQLRGAGTVRLTLIVAGQRSNAPTIVIR